MGIFKSFAEKLKNTGNRWTQSVSNLFSDDPVTDDFWDELEENLILGDVGIDTDSRPQAGDGRPPDNEQT